ncbi:MAG: phosphoenolpyruvate mutase [Quinella sp. 1Q5]|nr:phosphoenolpyruvate mutase [Quinella sp. 1Q5]
MKALILAAGLGSRMGVLTDNLPKCMVKVTDEETIIDRQLRQLSEAGITEIVITTGAHGKILEDYCKSLDMPDLQFRFVENPRFQETNYIYSIYLAREFLTGDILLLHGDLVLEDGIIEDMLNNRDSCMTVLSNNGLPDKDFKAVLRSDENGKQRIVAVGVDFFNETVAAQPFYKLNQKDWKIWLEAIVKFCEQGQVKCYAENAFNEVSGKMKLYPFDVSNRVCQEVDTPQDLAVITYRLHRRANRTVYMAFATDIIHGGHLRIIERAARLGKLVIGVLSDEAVASYKRYPLVPCKERMKLFKSIKGVSRVVEQKEFSYKNILKELKPDIVVHGDNWRQGFLQPLRAEVLDWIASHGGRLVEFPYSNESQYKEIEDRWRMGLSLPDNRRGRLKKILAMQGLVRFMEAHDGISGLIVEDTVVHADGKSYQFDGIWVSSLCDSTAKGKPDIELVDMTSRFRTIDDLTEVTTKPIIFDGDTGGLMEHFVYTVRSLEKLGVSAIIIEDKKGLKKNSLFGTEVAQTQADIEEFSKKIAAGKRAQKSEDFMIIARIESLILDRGMEDALKRAKAFVKAGADGIMIHSRKKEPDEIIEFVKKFRAFDNLTPLVIVPTTFPSIKEDNWKELGVNIVIYANHLLRAEVPAMRQTAEIILKNHRAQEADIALMGFKDIIRLIPNDTGGGI